MPSRNRIKEYAAESVYHVYNRGNNKMRIFLDDEDYSVFLNLLKRHLSKYESNDAFNRVYRNFYDELELLAFCLMPNHFHLLLFQKEDRLVSRLMSSVCTSYTGYFNKKYRRVGRLYQDAFKASLVNDEHYWLHISRYIHLNPQNWKRWEWSSLAYYLGDKTATWVRPQRVLQTFTNPHEYLAFVSDYHHEDAEQELKFVIANT